LDIICAICGKHFNNIETARKHRGGCKSEAENDEVHSIRSENTRLSPEEWGNIINSIKKGTSNKKESNLLTCPSCHQPSILKNDSSGLYECLNNKCRKKFPKIKGFLKPGPDQKQVPKLTKKRKHR
jgi:hypothetical protein